MHSNKKALAQFDIRDNGKYAQDFVAGLSLDDFKTDRMRFYAVTRAIEIVSEAARRLSPELHARHPELPWRAIMGVGEFVWRALHESLPALLAAIDEKIAKLD